MKSILLLLAFINLFFLPVFGQLMSSGQEPLENFPARKPYSFITNYPFDLYDLTRLTFNVNNLPNVAGITAGTLALIIMDQAITDKSKSAGDMLRLDPNSSQKRYLGKTIQVLPSQRMYVGFEGPHDLSSALYFIGDGWLHLGITGGFWFYGSIKKDQKSKQAAKAIAESIMTSATMVQLIKHISGRESPFVATVARGRWRFFPNQKIYHQNVPHYDAYPSGHVAATMATITVLSEFFPENKLIKPVGYTLLGALMFAMLNNGVHWASDYPLGIALGFTLAKIAAKKNGNFGSRQ